MIQEKYLVGAKALGILNSKDTDYVQIDNQLEYKQVFENGCDIFKKSTNYLITSLKFKSNDEFSMLSNYQYDQTIIGNDFPIKYSILDYKNELKEFLKLIVKNKMFNFDKRITINHKYCSKLIYHIAYNVFILQNNSTKLTNEQQEKIQLIHDCKMPIHYIDELEQMIGGL